MATTTSITDDPLTTSLLEANTALLEAARAIDGVPDHQRGDLEAHYVEILQIRARLVAKLA